MAREFRLPDIGEGLTEAEIVQWLVAEGEHVDADQPIVEVETDKAVVEIPSPFAGVVLSHGGAEGEVIEVGSILVVIGEQHGESFALPAQPAPAQTTPEPEPIVGTLVEEAEVLTSPEPTTSTVPTAIKALPIVRKLARDNDIDLSTVIGTGVEGRITREDVEAMLGQPEPEIETKAAVHETKPPQLAGGRQKMSRLRRTIATNMSKSWAEIPHVTSFDDVDATRLLEVRAALGDRHGVKIPIEALVIKAVGPAMKAFPEFNATIDGDEMVVHDSQDIGIAVDTPEGLMVAVIRDAAAQSILDLSAEVRRLGEGARQRSLSPDELSGQTFTISNIGAVGGGHGTPIVPYGTTAILSVGMAQMKPIVYGDDIAIAPVMPLSLSYDHRLVDGAQGRRFMSLVMENLEEPALFLA